MMSTTAEDPILELRAVRKYYRAGGAMGHRSDIVRAVDGVSIKVMPATTYSLVGETGAGKSTIAKLALGVEPLDDGELRFDGQLVLDRNAASLRHFRASISAVFQDPWSSLNPRMKARDIIAEPLITHPDRQGPPRKERVAELLELVGLHSLDAERYPHEFSGGQRQRLAIARAISTRPRLIVLDEPVSSLDVSVRAQIMNLLKKLQGEFKVSYLLIAHDLATVRFMSHRVGVMYLGKLVEEAEARELFQSPLHPYTRALISAAAIARDDGRTVQADLGEAPSPINPPTGCVFHPRCEFAFAPCPVVIPDLLQVTRDHWVACHLYPQQGGTAELGAA